MSITTTQKIIKIGTSKGVTLSPKDLKKLEADTGDELELIVRKKKSESSDKKVKDIAEDILNRYNQDFKNLAER